MNIRATITNDSQPSAAWSEFEHRAWLVADKEHYQGKVDFLKQKRYLAAYDKETLCGMAQLQLKAGVCRIDEFFVDPNYRKQGIGTALLKEIEQVAKKEGCHQIALQTGKGWSLASFCLTRGFAVVAEIPDYYAHHDFVELAKALKPSRLTSL